MSNSGNTDETLIILSMLDRIIVDDLLQEKELELFEKKKKWYDLWRKGIIEVYGLEEELLGWDRLKDRVVEWLKGGKTVGERKAMLDRCLTFLTYGPMPGKACSRPPGYTTATTGEIQPSPEARELSLEKICRLLGLEDQYQELFPSQWV
ncbi:MAG: hypothetical protein PHS13_08225 [Firmicutes bacterium]|nr:hypothetical protein [Bacillota bacterium]MDD3298658.1 hypothetical protein [Bacillota bacterium]MDD3851586.1 hypothetical protein [Bacillota bacterium]MDD4708417.1 hypothetical protein [Bacillota bacterium]